MRSRARRRTGATLVELVVVQEPVSYLCDTAAGTLARYAAYAIVQAQPIPPAAPPLDAAGSALLSRRVAACGFVHPPGTPQREALLTLERSVSEAGETARPFHPVRVENGP